MLLRIVIFVGAAVLLVATARSEDHLNPSTINQFRAANGRSVLHQSNVLASLCAEHARDMARWESLDHNGFFEHRGPSGAMAENVAYGCTTEACTIRQWAHSAGHRRNMLLPNAESYGIASAVSPRGRRYWCVDFGQ